MNLFLLIWIKCINQLAKKMNILLKYKNENPKTFLLSSAYQIILNTKKIIRKGKKQRIIKKQHIIVKIA